MILLHPSFEIQGNIDGIEILKSIERAGRTCYKSESYITDDSAKQFVANLIKSGHESVLEHSSVSVRVICSRSVSHRFVRHRIASYSQESTRWINYGKKGDVCFIIPLWTMGLAEGVMTHGLRAINDRTCRWIDIAETSEFAYLKLIEGGLKPEEAQGVLIHDLKTEIVMTMNLRSWRHFFLERTPKVAGEQVRQLSIPMLLEFSQIIPVVFDDIVSGLVK